MEPDTKTENDVAINNEGEGNESASDTVSLSKSEYEKLNQTLGSLKRELKDAKKSKEETKETPPNQKSDDSALLQELEGLALDNADISHSDDIELARNTAKKWGMSLRQVLKDEDFKVKLERQQTSRTNLEATSKVKGGAGTGQTKNSPEYWIAKGSYPSREEVPDRATRTKIRQAFMKNSSTSGKKFYND